MVTWRHPRSPPSGTCPVIGKTERDAWVRHMTAAVEETGIEEPYRRDMLKYFNDGDILDEPRNVLSS